MMKTKVCCCVVWSRTELKASAVWVVWVEQSSEFWGCAVRTSALEEKAGPVREALAAVGCAQEILYETSEP